MKNLELIIEGEKALEIKIDNKDLKTILQVISVFESGKINS